MRFHFCEVPGQKVGGRGRVVAGARGVLFSGAVSVLRGEGVLETDCAMV